MDEKQSSRFGKSMTVSGEVSFSGRLTVAGRMDGTLNGAELDIVEGGIVTGKITAGRIRCSGLLHGKVSAGLLQLEPGGCQVGTAEAKELRVASGAQLDCIRQSGEKMVVTQRVTQHVTQRGRRADNPRSGAVNLETLVDAFDEGVHPSCMDVIWSARGELFGQLLELLARRRPLVRVCGEEGSGRTSLLHTLADRLRANFSVLRFVDQIGSVAELLRRTALALKLDCCQFTVPDDELLAEIVGELQRRKEGGERFVLLIDDAETMYPATLEGLVRHLTSAVGERDGVLQVVLFGRMSMEEIMVPPILRYFAHEDDCTLALEPLSMKDTAEYLRYCLQRRTGGRHAGVAESVFCYDAIKKIHQVSTGNLARLNALAAKALRRGAAAGLSEIPASFVS